MAHLVSADDREFRQRLDEFAVPPAEFNHLQHVRLAYIYLCESNVEDALVAMRRWTFAYLDHHNADLSKYHETLTRAWMLAVRHFMARTHHSVSGLDFIEQNPMIVDSRIMMSHYSKGLLFSDDARREFVEPDLDPIPRYGDGAA